MCLRMQIIAGYRVGYGCPMPLAHSCTRTHQFLVNARLRLVCRAANSSEKWPSLADRSGNLRRRKPCFNALLVTTLFAQCSYDATVQLTLFRTLFGLGLLPKPLKNERVTTVQGASAVAAQNLHLLEPDFHRAMKSMKEFST
jgi:hypothetical protein